MQRRGSMRKRKFLTAALALTMCCALSVGIKQNTKEQERAAITASAAELGEIEIKTYTGEDTWLATTYRVLFTVPAEVSGNYSMTSGTISLRRAGKTYVLDGAKEKFFIAMDVENYGDIAWINLPQFGKEYALNAEYSHQAGDVFVINGTFSNGRDSFAIYNTKIVINSLVMGDMYVEKETANEEPDTPPIEYTVTFVADNVTVATRTYSVENKDVSVLAVPAKAGYTGKWESYQLNGGNQVVHAVYTPIEYTVTFVADNVTVATRTYTTENKEISLPEVPAKAGYTGKWEAYELAFGDVTVNAVYTKIEKAVLTPIEINLNEGKNIITLAAGQYATSYVKGMGDYTFVWTGDVTITVGEELTPVENGGIVTFKNPMFGQNNVVITPVNTDAECTVELTVMPYVEPALDLQLGANAVKVTVTNYYCAGVEVQFTATEEGTYAIRAADGEKHARVTYEANGMAEMVSLPYNFTLKAEETIKFIITTSAYMTLKEDIIDLVIEMVENGPIDPPTSAPDEPITSEPADEPTSSEVPDEPITSEPADEPTSSEPTTSAPTTSEPVDEPASSEPATSAPTTNDEPLSEPVEKEKSGCGCGGCSGVLGGVSAALTVVAAAAIMLKKKDD